MSDQKSSSGGFPRRTPAPWAGREAGAARRRSRAPWFRAREGKPIDQTETEPHRATPDREAVYRALRAEGLGVNVHYIPVHLHPYYRERFGDRAGEFPVAEAAYRGLISLPMFHGMTDQDVEDVTTAVNKVMAHFAREVA